MKVMNQGLFIVVLVLLILLISCKAFNYCVLKELFVNKKMVKDMMDDIYGANRQVNVGENVEDFRVCSDTEKKLMTSARIREECDNPENFRNYCASLSSHEREEMVKQGKCEPVEYFQDLPKCSEIHESARKEVRRNKGCVEGFVPNICCTTEMLLQGAEIGKDCKEPCSGFVNYDPFKEEFQPTIPPVNVAQLRDTKRRYSY